MLYSAPGSTTRTEYVAAFRDGGSRGLGWEASELDDETEWATVWKGRGLATFLGEPDHVEAIRAFLLGLIDEISAFQKAFPDLPWRPPQA